MHYFSTNRSSPTVSFREALLHGQPADRGLYFPGEIPKLSREFLAGIPNRSNEQIAFHVIQPYVDGSIPDAELFDICAETINFPFPLVKISGRISSLELFHGPTLAFKDVGARFMSRCLQHFLADDPKKTIVVVATSGDTGGAVAAGFHGIENLEVVVLYPKGKVSKVQELQLTTLGLNVTALEVCGTFDECQALAKRALADTEIKSKANLTSANSINIARWLPQQFYYFYALKQWIDGEPPVFSVPSGNFGNLAAGVVAHRSGMPVKKFIAATNANDVVPRFFVSREYKPNPTVPTLSNAMDVGDPSNFVRLLELFDHDTGELKKRVDAISISDAATVETMREVHDSCGYILDPHGAVAYRALKKYLDDHPEERGIFLETAHPVKFDSVEDILHTSPDSPKATEELFSREKVSLEIDVDYADVRDILVSKI